MTMYLVSAPDYRHPDFYNVDKVGPKIFLAGGITGCPEWQDEVIEFLKAWSTQNNIKDFFIFNPRRKNFPIDDPTAAHKQIKWEIDHLELADYVTFWFAKETIQPIVLFELGRWVMRKPIYVGMHAEYPRWKDVYEQVTQITKNYEFPFAYSLQAHKEQIADLIRKWWGAYV